MLGMGQTVVTSVPMLIVDGTVLVKKRLETGEERRREGERKRRGREGEREWEGRREEGEEKGRRKRGRERGGGGERRKRRGERDATEMYVCMCV